MDPLLHEAHAALKLRCALPRYHNKDAGLRLLQVPGTYLFTYLLAYLLTDLLTCLLACYHSCMRYFMNMRPCILAASAVSRGGSGGGAQTLATTLSVRRRLGAGSSGSSLTARPLA